MNTPIFQWGSGIIGGLAVLSVIYVFVRFTTFRTAGFALLTAGVVLIGLPVWQSFQLSWNKDKGFDFQFKTLSAKIDQLATNVENVKSLYAQGDNTLKDIAANVEKVRTTTTLDLASRVAAASPGQTDVVTTKLKPLSNPQLDAKTATDIANDPTVKSWIKNNDVLSDKVIYATREGPKSTEED